MKDCPHCGRPREEHNRHIRFKLPEPVLSIPEEDREAVTWGNDVLMEVKDLGSFVRILIPIKLSGGYTVTYSAWLSVHPFDLYRAWEVWTDDSAYPQLRLFGYLANKIPTWENETFKKPLDAAVLNVEHTPYAVDSSDEFMRRVIHDEWPHEEVLAAIAIYEDTP
ncbi:MAG TPA: DUF2199 domain-containing protein [Pyrinomonadaceae bacterium]|nr:DUF2199 domain-containing protein [Pyrinomonadaceae bacterium]